ncbi:TIGR04222 domain-containing membrane protein [Jiangella alkaliphila]|uniref:TIGR04222 domain-containing protein n=1 Tax=Jiangella alkaliphila TaxID=419479 RepID=A0A1H2FQS8_9ACTN|nr:TIGR04222 domain-containing membrane protein [Jiangella alkaliphila]SDU09727.1 TIGR04222 domain-containing protein [Jiangella alkaliphila]
MTALLVLFVLVVVGGIGSAIAVNVVDRRPRPDEARYEIGRSFDRTDTALVSGGVARAIDVTVLELVDRGLVLAEDGKLTVSDEVDRLLDTPMDSPEYKPPYATDEGWILVSVRAKGRQGLDAVRRDVLKMRLRTRLRTLADRGFLVTPLRRQWGPAVVWAPTLAGMFFCSMGLITSYNPLEDSDAPAAITIFAWFPVTLLTAFIWSRRPGYHGPDPRTARGRDIVDLLRAELPDDAPQAQRVAVGGFAAMTDDALRRQVQGRADESRWSIMRRGRAGHYGVNAALAADSGMTSGDGGDGDGGGDGGGGD